MPRIVLQASTPAQPPAPDIDCHLHGTILRHRTQAQDESWRRATSHPCRNTIGDDYRSFLSSSFPRLTYNTLVQ